MDVEIRPAELADVAELGRMHVATWRAAYTGIVPDEILEGLDAQDRAARWARQIRDGTDGVQIALDDGRIVGFVSFGPCRDEDANGRIGEVCAIYLAASHWRQGLGRRLMSLALEHLRSAGSREAVLWVLEANHRARRFYEALGFRTDGARRDVHIGKPIPEIRYRSPL
jgi:L-amino acid N-acyltransferase YncA